MHYNIVNTQNRWSKNSNLISHLKSAKQQVELGKLLDRMGDHMLDMDLEGELTKEVQRYTDLPFKVLSEMYYMIHVKVYKSDEIAFKMITNNLKSDGHKIDVYELMNIIEDKMRQNPEDEFIPTFGSYEQEMIKTISESYLIKYGTIG
jgi:Ca2+-binding EF-hand superfamily protein